MKGQPYTHGGYDGIDVSKHNGVIKWKEIAKNKRIKFVYIRATHGKGYVDRHYRRNIRLARKYGLKVGSYHLMSAGSSATAQFRDFQKMVKTETGHLHGIGEWVDLSRFMTGTTIKDLML